MHFDETFKHLTPYPGKSNSFLLIEPHLLYLGAQQADDYLELMKNPKYAESFHSDTVKLIQREVLQLFPGNLKGVTLIDLGPGYPDKSLPIAASLINRKIALDYIPVDISERFLEIAEQHLKPLARSTH